MDTATFCFENDLSVERDLLIRKIHLMRKKHKKSSSRRSSRESVYHASSSTAEFYAASPTEKPLYDDGRALDSGRDHRTSRHQSSTGRREEKMDPREKMALMAILKAVAMVLLLVIAFFLLWKGIGLYEESIWLDHAKEGDVAPVLQEVVLVEEFDIQDQNAREKFAERVERWREADRLVRSADALLQRNIHDQAIVRCQDALRLDPAHMGALERLGQLHFEKENHVEAVNAYIRLLSVDPSRLEVQKKLIQALDAFGDADAVMYMAEWYLDQNMFDADIQLYLANARYTREEFTEAAEAYGQVLRNSPRDARALARQAASYMQVGQYEKALLPLEVLRQNNYRGQEYYKQIAVCNAQLLRSKESVQTLGRAAMLFETRIVLGWLQDPHFDPIRTDRAFQSFTDRVGGEEFRLMLEKMAAEQPKRQEKIPGLVIPTDERLDTELLKPRQ